MLESELELSLKKSLRIKEDKMAALEAHLQESSKLNQQLCQELSTVSQKFTMAMWTWMFIKVKLKSDLHTGETELRGSESEAGGADGIVFHSSWRHWQSDD